MIDGCSCLVTPLLEDAPGTASIAVRLLANRPRGGSTRELRLSQRELGRAGS